MVTLLNKFDDNYVIKEDDVYGIISSYIKENDLNDEINDVIFSSSDNSLGSYNLNSKKIVLNNEKIWKYCYKNTDEIITNYPVNTKYYTYYLNYFYLTVLFHELEHVSQNKRYENTKNRITDIYCYLYELCQVLKYHNEPFYNKYHDLFPMEIEARNKSLLRSFNLMNYTKLPNNATKIMHFRYLQSLLSNYKRMNKYSIIPPIDILSRVSDNININDIYTLLDHAKLSKIERMNLGVNITANEYNSIQKQKMKILLNKK